jgi:hypothetical protein
MIPLMGTPAPIKNPSESYLEAQRAAEALRLMRQQTELLRQQTEALRKQNEAASAVPARALDIDPAIPPPRTPPATPQAGADSGFTGNMLNCSGWRILPAEGRLIYTIGILEGFQLGIASGEVAAGAPSGLPIGRHVAEIQKWTGKVFLTNGERIKAMDAFCSPVENSAVQVALAAQVAVMKANGYTADQVEAMAAILRRQAAEAAK